MSSPRRAWLAPRSTSCSGLGVDRVPMVRERVARVLGKEIDARVRPDEAVAMGAALYAARRVLEAGGDVGVDPDTLRYLEQMRIVDVGSRSLGINVLERRMGGATQLAFRAILSKNTALPCEGTQVAYTAEPNETSIVIPILEGDESGGGEEIGRVTIAGLPPGRPSAQPVEVKMRYDRDGILEVEAVDRTTQRLAQAKIDRGVSAVPPEFDADALTRTIRIP